MSEGSRAPGSEAVRILKEHHQIESDDEAMEYFDVFERVINELSNETMSFHQSMSELMAAFHRAQEAREREKNEP